MRNANLNHSLGLVSMVRGLVPGKHDLKNALKLGLGAAGGITLTDLLLSRALVRNGIPMIPVRWNPLAIPVGAWLISRIALKLKLGGTVADGIVAGGVGVGVSALLARFTSPAVAVSAEASKVVEENGGGVSGIQGFGFGRAFAPGVAGLGRLGATRRGGTALYGVGTPDMRAARMLSGATVAIEDAGLRGATVAYEDTSNFAASLT